MSNEPGIQSGHTPPDVPAPGSTTGPQSPPPPPPVRLGPLGCCAGHVPPDPEEERKRQEELDRALGH